MMSVPTPALLKKKLDEKRASEITQQEKASSPKPRTKKSPTRSNKSSRKVSSAQTKSSTTSSTQEKSQPKSNEQSGKISKRDFVRKDRLTNRPLQSHEGLQNLKDQMNAASHKAGGREFKDKPVRRKQSYKVSKKEKN
jgi:hypothetical protein